MRTALALALAGLALATLPSPVLACSCAPRTPEQAAADATAIFEGRVAAVAIDGDERVVSFDVVQGWRGVEHEHIEVRTASSDAACGVSFEVGRSYLVYAAGAAESLTTGLCSRTRRMEEADEDRAFLGSGTIPVDIVDEETTPERRTGVRPTRGGCAGCTIADTAPSRLTPVLALLVVALVAARRVRR